MKPFFRERHVMRVEANQVLCAQIAQNLVERLVESCPQRRFENPPAGTLRESSERVLATGVPPCIVRNRDHEDRINHGIRKLRGFRRALKIRVAGSIPAIGNDDQNLSPLAIFDVA
jgi:hypothetical protein